MRIDLDLCELRYWVKWAADAEVPLAAADYAPDGVSSGDAAAWCAAGVPPPIAAGFAALGLAPEDAARWGLIPDVVAEYLSFGFDADTAREWRDGVGFEAIEAAAWRDSGFTVADARIVESAGRVERAVLLQFAMAGMRPEVAIDAIRETGPTTP